MTDDRTTDFGYKQVDWAEKARRVRSVFDSVAPKYDLMNDLMSAGLHRLWKRYALSQTKLGEGDTALDVAAGTGDLARGMAAQVGSTGRVIMSDVNPSMLAEGRRRLDDAGIVGNVDYSLADAEALPFAGETFDCITIAFGLRNVTDKPAALAAMRHCLKPGGRLLVLEFSKLQHAELVPLYDTYSFKVLPLLGSLIAGDADSYRYLAESIRMQPDQETLKDMMRDAGLERCRYTNLAGGIVALHIGERH